MRIRQRIPRLDPHSDACLEVDLASAAVLRLAFLVMHYIARLAILFRVTPPIAR